MGENIKMIKEYISDLKKEFKGYNSKGFSMDVMAGMTVAAVALPLALAFGVSSGASAASGLITAIAAGLIIGILGGASYQISGPTGAMTSILLTLSAKNGLSGVLVAGALSGIILIIAALLKFGKLVSFIPSSVITGFTSGIAIIIMLGQIDNFFGTKSQGENAIQKLFSYREFGFLPNMYAVLLGVFVVAIMIIWPKKWGARFPSSLAGIIGATIICTIFNLPVSQVGEIPKTLLLDTRLTISTIPFSSIKNFIAPAISIAALGMIESLLCGASAGKMKHEELNADRELIAQGIGNFIIPFLGGVPATAAIARTSVAIKSGGNTRLVSVFQSVGLLASMFLLGSLMSRIPLSALAGVLVVTAFRMNEWHAIKFIMSKKFKSSMMQYFATMIATVVFDLTIAIIVGIIVSIILFLVKSCELKVDISHIDTDKLDEHDESVDHSKTKIVYLTGPLFFGTQDVLLKKLNELENAKTVIFSMRGVPSIDQSAVTSLMDMAREYKGKGIKMMFCGVQPAVMDTLNRAGFCEIVLEKNFFWDAACSIKSLECESAGAVG